MSEQEALGDAYEEDGLVVKDGSEVFEESDDFGEGILETLGKTETFETETKTKPRPLPVAMVPLSLVVRNPGQPRQVFDDDELFNVLSNLGQTAELIDDECCRRLKARLSM